MLKNAVKVYQQTSQLRPFIVVKPFVSQTLLVITTGCNFSRHPKLISFSRYKLRGIFRVETYLCRLLTAIINAAGFVVGFICRRDFFRNEDGTVSDTKPNFQCHTFAIWQMFSSGIWDVQRDVGGIRKYFVSCDVFLNQI